MNTNKNIIQLTETELKNIIKEHVQKVLLEYRNYSSSESITIDLWSVDIEDAVADYLDSLDDFPGTVEIELYYEIIPYEPGDYWTPPYGGYADLEKIEVDTDGAFQKILPPELYESFKDSVTDYMSKHNESYLEKIYDDYNDYTPEYERD